MAKNFTVAQFFYYTVIYIFVLASWTTPENRRRFFVKYANESGFDPLVPDHWYLPPVLTERDGEPIRKLDTMKVYACVCVRVCVSVRLPASTCVFVRVRYFCLPCASSLFTDKKMANQVEYEE
jgi:hypothetical protein